MHASACRARETKPGSTDALGEEATPPPRCTFGQNVVEILRHGVCAGERIVFAGLSCLVPRARLSGRGTVLIAVCKSNYSAGAVGSSPAGGGGPAGTPVRAEHERRGGAVWTPFRSVPARRRVRRGEALRPPTMRSVVAIPASAGPWPLCGARCGFCLRRFRLNNNGTFHLCSFR